ncbi:hypothetical protein BS78_05G276200 [Paspalum vaginatum]|nr:hypothetical protein BS78_05G276200 [Paspalum vaginatum]
MKKRLQEVPDRRDRFAVAAVAAPPPAPAMTADPRLAAMHKESTRRELSSLPCFCRRLPVAAAAMLTAAEQQQDEDSVRGLGAGGLGKTTLAKTIYDELIPQYDCGAFVSVGRKPDLVQVLTGIIFHLNRKEYEAIRGFKDLQLLIDELRKFLKDKRYFIVIDDVWSIESLKTIKSALDETNSESRVITTTRDRKVAGEEVYELDPLSFEDSKRLFYRLFGGEDKCPANHPDEASKKILKKCGGVPLAIITMASLLVGKSREEWFEVCNSAGFYGGKESKQIDDTEWILSLSYYDLPPHLKTLFSKTRTSLFQQGEECFNDLINRNMIQAVESEDTGDIYGCRVHDMVLDLIRGLSDKENFVTVSNIDDEEGTSSRIKVRRLAYQNKMMDKIGENMPQAAARSLVACGCRVNSWVLPPSFRLLRVLSLERCTPSSSSSCWSGNNNSIYHLGNLLHLRYLGIRHTRRMLELPEEIGALKHLQILDLEDSRVKQLPSSACLLTQLVCLRGCMHNRTRLPDGFLGKVTCLEELDLHVPADLNQQVIKDLGNLSQVRVLEVSYGCVLDPSMQSLGKLQKLQHVKLFEGHDKDGTTATVEWDTVVLPPPLRHLDLSSLFHCLPRCIRRARLPNLSHLDLFLKHMDEAGLRALGELPELRYLRLRCHRRSMDDGSSAKATVANIDGFFHRLRCCRFVSWTVQFVVSKQSVSFSIWNGKDECTRVAAAPPAVVVAVMPNLRELEFRVRVRNGSCGNLGLECLPSLHKVRALVDCEGATADDVNKTEAELRHAAQRHPRRPLLQTKRISQEKMATPSFFLQS